VLVRQEVQVWSVPGGTSESELHCQPKGRGGGTKEQ
jgi:hypothetical protein